MSDSYLSHLSRQQLSYRAKYLIENLATLELNGKIGLRDIKEEPGHSLMRKFTHLHQELVARKENFEPMFLKGSSVPKAMLGNEERLRELNKYAANKRPHLIKFGEKKYLEEYNFKVSLASSFNDPSLNSAQMDDEMKATYSPHPDDVKISKLDGTEIKGVQSIELTYELSHDYYVFCSASNFDVRLFGDFKYDSCLFIYNSQQFAHDLLKAISSKIVVEDHGYKNVTYVDPVRPEKGNLPRVEYHKHIKYLYQNEYRHVFIPLSGTSTPKDLFLSMPASKSYSELVCL